MKVKIAPSTLNNPRYFPFLDALLLILEDERHGIDISSLTSIFDSAWFVGKPKSDHDFIRLSATSRSHDVNLDKSTVTINDGAPRGGRVDLLSRETFVHPLDLIAFLTTPFAVIVEDEAYDGAFLLWMARALKFDLLVEAYRQGRFIFRHAGGKNGLVRSASIFARGVWGRADGRHARALQLWSCAVLDSDARFAGHAPNAAIVAELEPLVSFVWRLGRRSIESYLPYVTLQRFDASANFKRKVDALFRLTDTQRTHYHMKRGFRYGDVLSPTLQEFLAAAEPAVLQGEKQLFGGIAAADWTELASGFGKKLSTIYHDEAYRPTSADRNALHLNDIAELKQLLTEIYQGL